jgi:hypothetical protein
MRVNSQPPIPPSMGDFSPEDEEVISARDVLPHRPGEATGESQLTPQEQWASFMGIISAAGRSQRS